MSEQPGGEVLVYQRDNAPAIEVQLDGDTVWLSQQQLAELFQTSRTNVVEHIANIYAEGELSSEATCREFRQVRTEGNRQVSRSIPFYNLDLIISLGYRVKSSIATQFRIWATQRLREYLVQGFAMDDERLKTQASAYFDAAEFRAMNHEPTYMKDWLAHLEQLIAAMGGKALDGAGTVSHQQAIGKAEAEYQKYRAHLNQQPSDVEAAYLETVKKMQKNLEGKTP